MRDSALRAAGNDEELESIVDKVVGIVGDRNLDFVVLNAGHLEDVIFQACFCFCVTLLLKREVGLWWLVFVCVKSAMSPHRRSSAKSFITGLR